MLLKANQDQVLAEATNFSFVSLRFSLDTHSIQLLAKSSNYRDLVKSYVEIRSLHHKFGYSDLTRLSGFSSRSFLKDVTLNKKNLSLESAQKLIKGMSLTGDLAHLFKCMIELSWAEKDNNEKQIQKLNKSLTNLKSRIENKNSKLKQSGNDIYRYFQAPAIYAALGSPKEGASVLEIQNKTSVTPDVILPVLSKFIELNVVEKRKDRFFTNNNHLDFLGFGDKSFFQKYYLHTLQKVEKKASQNFSSPEELHFTSTFSIKKSDLPLMKEELRSLLLKYVDDFETASGDQVVTVACSLIK